MDLEVYKMIRRVEKCNWIKANDATIRGFIICLYTVEKRAKYLHSSLSCKGLIRKMERELNSRGKSTMFKKVS